MHANPTTEQMLAKRAAAFAHFSALGTWTNVRKPCKFCNWHWQRRVPPLVIQWEPSSVVIGDFSWDGPFGYLFVIQENVAQALSLQNFECQILSVKVVAPERKRRTVAFPYSGPTLHWGVSTALVELDMEASGVELESLCSVCGNRNYTFRNHGIAIQRSAWNGEKMFRIVTNEPSAATFVTEEGKHIIENERFSNIEFSEAGLIR